MKLRPFIRSLGDILFPRQCAICRKTLNPSERHLCTACLLSLPYTGYRAHSGNPAERMFWEHREVESVTSYLHYFPGTGAARPVISLKYFGKMNLGQYLGEKAAEELLSTSFFNGVDWLVPVPLHKVRWKTRGYNQSHEIARGVSRITKIPVKTNVLWRRRNNRTQTRLTRHERKENVDQLFVAHRTRGLEGKHLMLIDDVLTTGATLGACIHALSHIKDLRISILTLYVTGRPGTAPDIHHPDVTTVKIEHPTDE